MLLRLKFVQEYACTSRLCKLKFSKLRNVQCGMVFQNIAVPHTISYSPWKGKYTIYECRRNDSNVLIEPKATDMTKMKPRNLDSLVASTDEETLIENCFHLNCTSGGLQTESKSNFSFHIMPYQAHAHQSSYYFDAYNNILSCHISSYEANADQVHAHQPSYYSLLMLIYHAISHHIELKTNNDGFLHIWPS